MVYGEKKTKEEKSHLTLIKFKSKYGVQWKRDRRMNANSS